MADYVDGQVARWLREDFERQGADLVARCEAEILRRVRGGEDLVNVFGDEYRRALRAVGALQVEFVLRLDEAVEASWRRYFERSPLQ